MDAVAVMAPGRFRRRLSDDHSDIVEPSGSASASDSAAAADGGKPWPDGTGSTRGRLPWLSPTSPMSPRERRHPLRDVRLSCFRSYLPGALGGTGNGGGPDGDALCGDSASPRSPRTPRTPRTPRADGSSTPKAGRGLSLSVRRSPGRSRGSKSSENVYFVSPPRQQQSDDAAPGQGPGHQTPATQRQQSPPSRMTDSPQSAVQGGQGGNLSARLRALSARCMALVHATGERAERHLGRHKSASKRSARPCKQRSFSSGALPGLHDFQRRQLNPIYRDEDPDADPQDGEDTALSAGSPNGILCGEEDCDSGILVSDAGSTPLSSLPGLPGCGAGGVGGSASVRAGRGSLPWAGALGLGAVTAASRALRSASLDRELLGNSPLLDQDEDADDHGASSQARRSRNSTKSSSSSSEISEIFSRFQRRRVAGTTPPAGAAPSGSSSSRPSSPPLLPAPPQRSAAGSAGGPGPGPGGAGRRREFHLVRLTRAAPAEELGIFIAKSEAPDRGAQGYVVAHIVPGGLAHRDGQLRLGDELVVVNGRQLRGLSMAAARQRLRAGPAQVDIVIARPAAAPRCQCQGSEGRDSGRDSGLDSGLDTSGSGDSMTEGRDGERDGGEPRCCRCQAPGGPGLAPDHTPSPARRTLLESSVDYENVVLRPRERTPVAPAPSASSTTPSETPPCAAPSAEDSATPRPAPRSRSPPAPATLRPASPRRSPSPSTSPSPSPSASPSPGPSRQQLFQKRSAAPASAKAARRSLALVSRSSSPPLEPLHGLESGPPAETQHHSLKRRARRHGHGRHGHGEGSGSGSAGSSAAAPATEFRVELRKGPGCGALGFTVVGGADSPRGALPIFVRSVLEGGQAALDGQLHPGDELLSLNGQPLRGATHAEAVAMFRAVRAGPVLLCVCRRTSKKSQSCSDLVVGPAATLSPATQQEAA